VSEPSIAELRAAFDAMRKDATIEAPSGWQRAIDRLRDGPDAAGALLRAGRLPDACLSEPFPPALIDLLHQGNYPTRLLALDPTAIDVLREEQTETRSTTTLLAQLRAAAARDGLEAAVARVRNREYLRLARREVEEAPVEEVGAGLCDLFSACAQVTLETIDPALPEQVVVFGMGKLGGNELNFLSDVDLVFCHADDLVKDEETAHATKTKLFGQLRRFVSVLEGTGEWRPLFRIDLRLRPFGTRGPLSLSVSASEGYYERHGRNWERQVWLRARPIAGNLALGAELTKRLEPFVYRRSVSPEMFDEVAALMRRARRDAKQALGSEGVDVKHDAGGIREVEFFAQGLQILNGGRTPAVRAQATLVALDRLMAAGLLADREHERLSDAYRWLRKVEHRVQLVEGQQTHQLPTDQNELSLLARRLSPSTDADQALAELRASLRQHRHEVMSIAQSSYAPEEAELIESERLRLWARDVVVDPGAPPDARIEALTQLGLRDPQEGGALLQHLRKRPEGAFAAHGKAARGADRLLLACLDSADPDSALRRLAEFEKGRPAHYATWRFLAEPGHTEAVRLVAELLGSSEPMTRGFVGFPDDQQDDSVSLMIQAAATRLPSAQALNDGWRRFAKERSGSELSVDATLLRFKHQELVRIGLFDLGRRPDPLDVGRALSELADLIVRELCRDVWSKCESGRDSARVDLGIFALGKYGMQAMDYGSDLDLMFVFRPYDEDAPNVREDVIKIARGLIARLEDRSRGVRLYEVDMRLRPSGRQGLLVSALGGFSKYHSRPLPAWERLALLRLRSIAEIHFGSDEASVEPGPLCVEVESLVAASVHQRPDDEPEVGPAIRDLKARIETEHARETKEVLNPKTGVGGCLEAELLVGARQLAAGGEHPSRGFAEALDELVRNNGLKANEARDLATAYRFLRLLLNRLRMMHGGGSTNDSDRLALNSPRLSALARRMGLADANALVASYRAKRAVVREAFDRYYPPK
jgi:glutamate-ammonia-ligase adenylyltransferase